MIRLALLCLVISLFPGGRSWAQKPFDKLAVRRPIRHIAARIAADSKLDGKLVGEAPVVTEQYRRFIKLSSSAVESELIVLTDYPSPAVRCYAYQELYNRNSQALLPVLHKNENDTAKVTTRNGCIVGDVVVIDYMWYHFTMQQRSKPIPLGPADTLLLYRISEGMLKRSSK